MARKPPFLVSRSAILRIAGATREDDGETVGAVTELKNEPKHSRLRKLLQNVCASAIDIVHERCVAYHRMIEIAARWMMFVIIARTRLVSAGIRPHPPLDSFSN
jgi:hypothetical protein